MKPHLQTLLRTATGIASLIAPGWTGRRAFRMFSTPPASARRAGAASERVVRAHEQLARGTRVRLEHADGHIVTWTFEPHEGASRGGAPQRTVVLVHGWTSRAAFMTAFVEPLRGAGCRVVAMDLPGHGESGGDRLHLGMAVAALRRVHECTGPWHGAVAHSFGGAAVLTMADGTIESGSPVAFDRVAFDRVAFDRVAFDRVALIGAPESIRTIFEGFGRAVGLGERAQAAMNGCAETITGRPLADYRCARMLERLRVPALVLHAPEDREVAFDEARALAAAGDFVRLEPIDGAGHRRILYDPRTVSAVASFFG